MLFIENPYLKEFETKVQKVENDSIILEQTAFYEKSGGQPGDVGKITLNGKEINILSSLQHTIYPLKSYPILFLK